MARRMEVSVLRAQVSSSTPTKCEIVWATLPPPPQAKCEIAAHDLRLRSVRSVPDYEKKKPVWEQIDGNETNQESINAAKINAKIAGLSNSN